MRPGDRVAILSENRPEWAIADYACLAARCTDVPIYPTLPAKQAEYILRDSGAVAVLVSTAAQLDKVQAVRAAPARAGARRRLRRRRDRAPASSASTQVLAARARGARPVIPTGGRPRSRRSPDDLATLIYTSGTTGDPKGVMLSHGNIASNVTTCVGLFSFTAEDECLSFLPLSHIFERMFGHYCMFHAGVVINYAESVDTVPADMQEIRPHADGLGAAALREDLRPGAGQRADGVAAPEADLRLVAGGGRAVGGGDDREAAGAAGAQAPARAGRPAGVRQAAGPGPAGASASSSRAARRSRPRSRASSTPRACRSWRATGSPRPRR